MARRRRSAEVARVPPTLAGVLQARLDALTLPERLALHQSAVVGHEFWDQALAAIDAAAPPHSRNCRGWSGAS
jgi:hypothetical protein